MDWGVWGGIFEDITDQNQSFAVFSRGLTLDGFINKVVCLKYRLDPQVKGRYIYCLSPPADDQIIDKSQVRWQSVFYGQILFQIVNDLTSENLDSEMISAVGLEGFWEEFTIQNSEQGGSQWREIIGIAKVKEPFEVNPKIYTKVIDNIFKKDTPKKRLISEHDIPSNR